MAEPILPQQPAQQETSLLDQLRQRVQQDFTPQPVSSQERLATFGRGVLSNRGSFLDNLSAGLTAQNQADVVRREEGRKAFELQAEMARRAEELRLRQEELRDPSFRNLREAQAFYYRSRPDMAAAGAGVRGRLTDAQYATIYNQAEQEARRQYPDPTPGMPDTPAAQESRRVAREEFKNRRIEEIMRGLTQRQSGVPVPPPSPAQPRQPTFQIPLVGTPRPAPMER